jgi:coenzyme F420-reducing hydrogenase delta subunit
MKKYAKVINELNQCEVGLGDDVEFYQSIGMTEIEVEQGYDGIWYVAGCAPQQTVEEKNEAIKRTRANLYAELIDPLHAEKQRKVVLETWTETDEAEYVEQVKALTAKIQEENPYIE